MKLIILILYLCCLEISAQIYSDSYVIGDSCYRDAIVKVINVNSDGSEDYISITAALAAITNNSSRIRYEIRFGETFNLYNLKLKEYVYLVGSDTANARLVGYLPADTTVSVINTTSTLDMDTINTIISNVTVTAQNMKYCFHSDAGAVNISSQKTIQLINCRMIHYGNAEAIAEQGEGAGIWTGADAIGSGLSSNLILDIDSGYYKGGRNGIRIHTANDEVNGMSYVYMTDVNTYSETTNGIEIDFEYANGDIFYFDNAKIYNGTLSIQNNPGVTYTDATTITGTTPKIVNGYVKQE